MKLLSWTAQHGELSFASVPRGPWHDLLVGLVLSDLLTVFSFEEARRIYSKEVHPQLATPLGIPGDTPLVREMALARVRAAYELYEMRRPAGLRLTHSGRVRLSELKQALRAGREREPFGILWDARHWEQDLQVAILDTTPTSPLALAFLDMNGLKQVNDSRGHDAGDRALKSFFQAVASSIGDCGEAYRVGGDEVLVVLPNCDAEGAVKQLTRACNKLMGERLEPSGTAIALSIAAGVVTSSDAGVSPTDLRSGADKVQYRAKEESKKETPRPSVIAVSDKNEMTIIPFAAAEGTKSC